MCAVRERRDRPINGTKKTAAVAAAAAADPVERGEWAMEEKEEGIAALLKVKEGALPNVLLQRIREGTTLAMVTVAAGKVVRRPQCPKW